LSPRDKTLQYILHVTKTIRWIVRTKKSELTIRADAFLWRNWSHAENCGSGLSLSLKSDGTDILADISQIVPNKCCVNLTMIDVERSAKPNLITP